MNQKFNNNKDLEHLKRKNFFKYLIIKYQTFVELKYLCYPFISPADSFLGFVQRFLDFKGILDVAASGKL